MAVVSKASLRIWLGFGYSQRRDRNHDTIEFASLSLQVLRLFHSETLLEVKLRSTRKHMMTYVVERPIFGTNVGQDVSCKSRFQRH